MSFPVFQSKDWSDKWKHVYSHGINTDVSHVGSTIADLIDSTLFTKKERNWLHVSAEASGLFRVELIVLKRTRGLWQFNTMIWEKYLFLSFSLYPDQISNILLTFQKKPANCLSSTFTLLSYTDAWLLGWIHLTRAEEYVLGAWFLMCSQCLGSEYRFNGTAKAAHLGWTQ